MHTFKIKEIMVRAWEIARAGVSEFGGSIRNYFREALRMSWSEQEASVVANAAPVREEITLGNCYINKNLRYVGKVAAGGRDHAGGEGRHRIR